MVKRDFWPGRSPVLVAMALISLSVQEGKAQQTQQAQRPQMELLDTKITATQTTLDIVGQVKNIAPREVSGVTVYCDFQDSSGTSIRTVQGTLKTDPLAPNKVSDFTISTKYDPAIKRFNVTFAELFGGKLVTKDSRKQ